MSPPWHLLILLGLAAVFLFVGLGATALTDRDEGANAEAAREMLEQRAWITPTLNYVPRFEKPALVYWAMAAGYAALGVSETTARLPSAVAAGATLLLQYAFARWALGPAVALRAAVILALTLEFVAIGRMALTDAMLVLWTTAAGFAFFGAHHGAAPRGRWYAAMYVAMALGTLTKGPVGLLVPAVGIALYLTVASGWSRFWREGRPGWGLLLLLLVAAPWYIAMLWQHGAEYSARARRETVGRVFRTVTGPGGTLLFYVPVVLVGFFPWSAFLPGALVGALRGARARAATDRGGAATVFAAAWVVAVLVLFSLFQSRLPHYVAPLFPAAALVTAATWPTRTPALARALLLGLGLVLGTALIVAWAMGPTVGRLLASAYPAGAGAAPPASALALGAVALVAAGTGALYTGARLFPVLATLTAVLFTLGLHVALPAFSAEFVAPPGDLLRRAAPDTGPCDVLVVFGPYRPSLVFYARRPIVFVSARDPTRLVTIADRSGRLILLAPRTLLDRLPPAVADLATVDAAGGYVLLARPPAAARC